jgi:F-type H+-transporting ATPase subunit b
MERLLFLADFDPGDIWDQFMPRLEEVIIQLLATAIVLFMLYKFLWKKVRFVLKARQDRVEGDIYAAEEKNKAAALELEEARKKNIEADNKYRLFLENAKIDALNTRDQILEEAKQQSDKERLKAHEQIQLERKASEDEIKKQIVDIAFKAAEKILEREIDEKDNQKIVSDFISKEFK